jgi:hypothetical protein
LILDDEESLEQIMTLLLLRGLWLSTEDTLHNDVPEIRCGSITIYGIIISGIITCIIIILHI